MWMARVEEATNMIWYDASTGEPVAPGACEDGGPASVSFYDCLTCEQKRPVKYDQALAICMVCHAPLLTTGLPSATV